METLLLSKLPGVFAVFGPLADIMPIIPILFFLLAFVWQASVGFRYLINLYSKKEKPNYGRNFIIGNCFRFN